MMPFATIADYCPALANAAETAAALEPVVGRDICPRTRKMRHRRRQHADEQLRSLRADPKCYVGRRLRVYRCRTCGDYHVGHA